MKMTIDLPIQSDSPNVYRIPQNQNMIAGNAAPEFEQVRIEFERNFVDRGEQGAACTIFHRGAKVVDLWGGFRCNTTQEP